MFDKPAGREQNAHQVEACRKRPSFSIDHLAYLHFEGDAYVMGATARDLSYAVSVRSLEFEATGQVLHPGKCEVLVPEGGAPRVCLWSQDQVAAYVDEGAAPLAEDADLMKPVSELLVLGSKLSLDSSHEHLVVHRLQMAWKAWHAIRPQLR